jgi:general stress protein YciG
MAEQHHRGGNFANDRERAAEAGRKGGEHSHSSGGEHSHSSGGKQGSGNFDDDPKRAARPGARVASTARAAATAAATRALETSRTTLNAPWRPTGRAVNTDRRKMAVPHRPFLCSKSAF